MYVDYHIRCHHHAETLATIRAFHIRRNTTIRTLLNVFSANLIPTNIRRRRPDMLKSEKSFEWNKTKNKSHHYCVRIEMLMNIILYYIYMYIIWFILSSHRQKSQQYCDQFPSHCLLSFCNWTEQCNQKKKFSAVIVHFVFIVLNWHSDLNCDFAVLSI